MKKKFIQVENVDYKVKLKQFKNKNCSKKYKHKNYKNKNIKIKSACNI